MKTNKINCALVAFLIIITAIALSLFSYKLYTVLHPKLTVQERLAACNGDYVCILSLSEEIFQGNTNK